MKITEKQLRQLVRESLQQTINENESDEDTLGNFFSSVGQGVKDMLNYGGVNSFKQGFNDTMANKSAEDAANYRKQVNAGYKNIPGADGIMKKYDGKITKLTQQIQSLKQEVTQLKNEKKTKLQQLRSEHMSNMTSKANKFNNTAAQASARAQDAKNSRLAFNGQQNTQQYRAALEESKLDKIISESIKKVLMKG